MLPMVLCAAAHHDQLAVLQQQFALFLRVLVAQGEFARRAQTKRSNHGVVPQFCLVIGILLPLAQKRAAQVQLLKREEASKPARRWGGTS